MIAAVPRAGGTRSRAYALQAEERRSKYYSGVVVGEEGVDRLLPLSCPDRHINDDGSFCLGLGAEHLIVDETSAGQWWDKLQVFLSCQETAHETRAWPDYAQLSHGDEAAQIQIHAEAVARDLGMPEVYEAAVATQTGPIVEAARRADLTAKRLRNGRAACPCGRVDKSGRTLLRRQCWGAKLDCLAVLEGLRLKAVRDFWATRTDAVCCGTMDCCRLQHGGIGTEKAQPVRSATTGDAANQQAGLPEHGLQTCNPLWKV